MTVSRRHQTKQGIIAFIYRCWHFTIVSEKWLNKMMFNRGIYFPYFSVMWYLNRWYSSFQTQADLNHLLVFFSSCGYQGTFSVSQQFPFIHNHIYHISISTYTEDYVFFNYNITLHSGFEINAILQNKFNSTNWHNVSKFIPANTWAYMYTTWAYIYTQIHLHIL